MITDAIKVTSTENGWEVTKGQRLVATCATSADAWRLADRLEGEPVNQSERRVEFVHAAAPWCEKRGRK